MYKPVREDAADCKGSSKNEYAQSEQHIHNSIHSFITAWIWMEFIQIRIYLEDKLDKVFILMGVYTYRTDDQWQVVHGRWYCLMSINNILCQRLLSWWIESLTGVSQWEEC